MANKYLNKKFYNPFEDENFIIERVVEENNIKFYELNYYDTYFEDYIPVSDISSFIEENDIKEVVNDDTIKERARKKKKEIDKIKEKEDSEKKESKKRRRFFAFIDDSNFNKFLNTKWKNPSEDGDNVIFEITKVQNNQFELTYKDFYDYISAYDFDIYCADNYITPYDEKAKLVYPLLGLTKASSKKKITSDINDVGDSTFQNLGEDGRKLLKQIENYKFKMNNYKNLLINEKDQKELEKYIKDLDNVSSFIYNFVFELENHEVVDNTDKKLEFSIDDEIEEDIDVPDLEEKNIDNKESETNFDNPFEQANENDQKMEEEFTSEESVSESSE